MTTYEGGRSVRQSSVLHTFRVVASARQAAAERWSSMNLSRGNVAHRTRPKTTKIDRYQVVMHIWWEDIINYFRRRRSFRAIEELNHPVYLI